ncbi:hypothetical protein SAMN02745172_02686 [Pseudoxanthobacter soli DSM 19599]|uniref:Chlorophyllide reductase n=1 Tax=Pseudoxanthobacter soli DSM 19599 TaxID=1123029 RepID=A0A1M7ZMZ4_9HYPH|nr:hypothetical protein [Pseudoxanthobacter soli]SHO66036.1 hypothetical protein SAMN02745172_02686 [Pseudoxanthobacter soli DSM 19599]
MNARLATLLTLSLGLALPAQATPSTPTGAISVAQVVELIERAPTDNAARNAAMAYLAGVGETTGLLVAEAGRRSSIRMTCSRPLGISSDAALAAFARTDKATWGKTAATPILVEDMLSRAGCL